MPKSIPPYCELNGHSGVLPDVAIRLEQVFGSSADAWLRMKMHRGLGETRQQAATIRVNRRYAEPIAAKEAAPFANSPEQTSHL